MDLGNRSDAADCGTGISQTFDELCQIRRQTRQNDDERIRVHFNGQVIRCALPLQQGLQGGNAVKNRP
jgi:hypothetical protein